MKLDSIAIENTRRWVRRADVVENEGVEAAPGIFGVPYTGDFFLNPAKYYKPSFETDQEFLTLGTAEELKKLAWKEVFVTTDEKKRCVEMLSFCKDLRVRLRQLLSDELSSRKRKACDLLFTSLGYHCLQSRFLSHSNGQKAAKSLEITDVKSKLLQFALNVDLLSCTWRTESTTSLCKEGANMTGIHEDIDIPDGNL